MSRANNASEVQRGKLRLSLARWSRANHLRVAGNQQRKLAFAGAIPAARSAEGRREHRHMGEISQALPTL